MEGPVVMGGYHNHSVGDGYAERMSRDCGVPCPRLPPISSDCAEVFIGRRGHAPKWMRSGACPHPSPRRAAARIKPVAASVGMAPKFYEGFRPWLLADAALRLPAGDGGPSPPYKPAPQ
jgi:hypothetical protein